MKSKFFSSAILASVIATGFALTACGDDNNPGNAPTGNLGDSSSSMAPITGTSSSSTGIIGGVSSSDAGQLVPPEQQANGGCAAGQVATPVDFPQDEFIDIGEVYKNIQCNEKVVFIVRHGKRESFVGSESALTEDGFEETVEAGKKMAGPEPFKYIFSGMTRTYQTALGFAVGRGEYTYEQTISLDADEVEHLAFVSPTFMPDTLKQLKDGWYTKDKAIYDAYLKADTTGYLKNSNVMITDWVYEGNYADAFYDLDARSKEFLALIVKDYKDMPKYTLAASHDQLLMPLTAWATDKKIDLKLHDINSRKWLRYLAGVAIIINDKNEVRYVAVRGGATGVM